MSNTDELLRQTVDKNYPDDINPEDLEVEESEELQEAEEETEEQGEDGEETDGDEAPEQEEEAADEAASQDKSLDEDPSYRAYLALKQELEADPNLVYELDRAKQEYYARVRGQAPLPSQPEPQLNWDELLIPVDEEEMMTGELLIAKRANQTIRTLTNTLVTLSQEIAGIKANLSSHDAARRQSQIDSYVSSYEERFVKQTGAQPPSDFSQKLRGALTEMRDLSPAAVEEKYKALAFDVLSKPTKTATAQQRQKVRKAAVAPSSKPTTKRTVAEPTNPDDIIRKAIWG